MIRPRRSVLYMPGSNARAIEKARALPVDGIVLDLEDAVALEAKDAARRQVVAAIKAGGFGSREVVMRTNAPDTPWFADDIAAAAAAAPDAILVPKVSTPDDIDRIARLMIEAKADLDIRVWVMIETPLAVLNAAALAARARDGAARLAAFVIGPNDLAKETRARLVPGRAPMLTWLSACVLAAHAYGLDILDGVYNNLSDADGFRAECQQGRDLGFDGKTLIHPSQVDICNAVFSPDAEEVAEARKILAAFDRPENHGRGVIALDGRMVERMHADMARRTVAIADAIGLEA